MTKTVPFGKVAEKWRADPDFPSEYDALEEEFALAAAVIKARADAGLTQEELANRMGTTQSVIAHCQQAPQHHQNSAVPNPRHKGFVIHPHTPLWLFSFNGLAQRNIQVSEQTRIDSSLGHGHGRGKIFAFFRVQYFKRFLIFGDIDLTA